MSENKIESISYAEVIEIMKRCEVFVKTVCSSVKFHKPWEDLLAKMANPNGNRTSRRKSENIDPSWRYDPLVGSWYSKQLNRIKLARNFTAKTCVSLCPPDGIGHVFQSADPKYKASLGILLDSRYCKIDERYIFPSDANMHLRWWKKQGKM